MVPDGPHCSLRVRSYIHFSSFILKVILCLWTLKAGTAGLTNAAATALSVGGTEAPVHTDERWGGTWNVSTLCCSFSGRNTTPVIGPEGWGRMCILAW